jgi:surface polysaccharide O-acyltransferase-like enzyme
MAFLVVFKNIFQRARPWWNSLSANAYGIYLVHYIFVIWCQYLLLGMDLPALAKFLISFVLSAAASWTVTAAVRLVPGIKKVL